jgi:hypothetical protein
MGVGSTGTSGQGEQTTIFDELERRRAWDELAAARVVVPLIIGDASPISDARDFATGFLRNLADSS